jgi:hypothetical protein
LGPDSCSRTAAVRLSNPLSPAPRVARRTSRLLVQNGRSAGARLRAPEDSAAHAELLSDCARLIRIWGERAGNERELWNNLELRLTGTSNAEEALRAYSETAARRLRMALEDAQRIFEEHQAIMARFSRPPG